jgi:hypothetical protein
MFDGMTVCAHAQMPGAPFCQVLHLMLDIVKRET